MKPKMILMTAAFLCVALANAAEIKVDFSEGKWDKSMWRSLVAYPVKPPPADFAPSAISFKQEADCVSVEFDKKELDLTADNAVMVTDGAGPDFEFVAKFGLDDGRFTAPGFCLSPQYGKDMVIEKCYAVFVANYTMAVWQVEADREKRSLKYTHLARLVRWSDPAQKHVLRCRLYSEGFIVQVDNSDPVLFKYAPGFKGSGEIGVWGCHGKCKFFSLQTMSKGTLELMGKKPSSN